MPFIRYENGDMATLLTEKCICGLNSALMKNIEGRTVDTLTLKNGAKAHGVFFTTLLYEVGITTEIISRFQIAQFASGAIEFCIKSKAHIAEDLFQTLKTETTRFLTEVTIKITPHIPNEPNGNFRYIKQSTSTTG